MDRIQWRVRTITMTSDPLPAQPSPKLANHRPVSRSRDLSRPIRSQYCRYITVAGIWDRYTIIHWKRPEPFFSQTRLLGQFSGLPAAKNKTWPWWICSARQTCGLCIFLSHLFWQSRQESYHLHCQQRDLIFTSFTIFWTNSWPGRQCVQYCQF